MPEASSAASPAPHTLHATARQEHLDWIPALVTFLARSWRTLAACVAAALALACLYLALAHPRFTAAGTIVIDTQATAALQQQPQLSDPQLANGIVESQVEVLHSERVARAVVERLRLADDAGFLANGDSLLGAARGFVLRPFETGAPDTPERRATVAAELLFKLMRVERIGLSYVLTVSVTARDPVQAARLANAVIDAYVDVGLDAKSDNIRRASRWLEQRLKELRDQALAADAAVQAFKAGSNIVDTDKGLMNERHLGELNSQLVLARAHTADMRARYERIDTIVRGGPLDGNVSDALQNDAILHLRKEYDDDARQAADWQNRLGPDHAAVVGMRTRLANIESQIRAELRRIAQSYQSDYEMAQASEHDIQTQLDALATAGSVTNASLVQLRALQSSATTYRALYETFLQRYTQAVQDQSFPLSEVQILTRPSAPLRRSHPKPLTVLALATSGGLALGFGLALIRAAYDTGLRSAAEARAAFGVPCLAMLPRLPRRAPPRSRGLVGAASGRDVCTIPAILRAPIDDRGSPLHRAVQALCHRLQPADTRRAAPRVLGCVSARPDEGKSTVAASLALGLAQAGFRTLLVDGDADGHGLSRALLSEPDTGDTVREPTTGLAFLPARAMRGDGPTTAEIAPHAAQLAAALAASRTAYDYIVVDLPVLSPVTAPLLEAAWLDGVLLVVEWARTPAGIVRDALAGADLAPPRLLGVVLNKVEPRALRHSGSPPVAPRRWPIRTAA
jgi:polysaccharide biosynthesis transport protein